MVATLVMCAGRIASRLIHIRHRAGHALCSYEVRQEQNNNDGHQV